MLKIVCAISLIIFLAITGVFTLTVIQDGREKYSVSFEGAEIPQFSEIEVPFDHISDSFSRQPFMAGAIIDVDNDGVEELFLGGGIRQADGIFSFQRDHFVNIADQVGFVKQGAAATLGAVVLDVDENGYSDLLITRKSGIWLYRNIGGQFTSEKIKVELPPNITPINIAIADLNRDGHFDMFVPAIVNAPGTSNQIVFNSGDSTVASKLFINNGDDTFVDITESAGLQYHQNGLQAIFADIDDDGLEDLVVVYSLGKVRTWKNRGSLLFENKRHIYSDVFGLYMGLGVGDYNNDGKIDFLLTNSGSTIPEYLAKGDLRQDQKLRRKWVLLKNAGDFVFEDDADRAKLADYQLSRGAVFADLNLDGLMDLIVAQNNGRWPLHWLSLSRLSGRVFVQNKMGQFAESATSSLVENKKFSITPLVADFNLDGQPDIVHVNMAGLSKVFLSIRGENHFLKVKLPDIVRSLGAEVSVITGSGKVLKQVFLPGKELCSDSSHELFFGLAKEKVTDIKVQYKNGEEDQASGVIFNTTVIFK